MIQKGEREREKKKTVLLKSIFIPDWCWPGSVHHEVSAGAAAEPDRSRAGRLPRGEAARSGHLPPQVPLLCAAHPRHGRAVRGDLLLSGGQRQANVQVRTWDINPLSLADVNPFSLAAAQLWLTSQPSRFRLDCCGSLHLQVSRF